MLTSADPENLNFEKLYDLKTDQVHSFPRPARWVQKSGGFIKTRKNSWELVVRLLYPGILRMVEVEYWISRDVVLSPLEI